MSCKKNETVNIDNFSEPKAKDSLVKNISEIDIGMNDKQKLYYHVSLFNNEEKDSVVDSYFLLYDKKYDMPKKFSNNSPFNFKYSLFPKYSDANELIYKTYKSGNKNYILLRGENPFCNGSNCQRYNLHLLIIEDKRIISNNVFFYNSNEVNFEDTVVTFVNSTINLMNGNKLLSKIN